MVTTAGFLTRRCLFLLLLLLCPSLLISLPSSSAMPKGMKALTSPQWPSAAADSELLRGTAAASVNASLVVAKDGSGHYTTISDALSASVKLRSAGSGGGSSSERFVIYVKAGVYQEHVDVDKSMENLMLVGDGMDATVITGSRCPEAHFDTFTSGTFVVKGNGFIAQDMTFENTAGPEKGQAVALLSTSNFSVFYRCGFKGYQDTLYAHSGHQFYRDCDIYGTIDFIFGKAAAVFQNCNIFVRRPLYGQANTVTAQGRDGPNETTGFVFHNSTVTAASDLKPFQNLTRTYLGRPWRPYSRTVFIECMLDELVNPAGWLEWREKSGVDTLYYGEYMNRGPGSYTDNRVKWTGFHVITSASEAGKFTVDNFIGGSSWIPATGVPFTQGL